MFDFSYLHRLFIPSNPKVRFRGFTFHAVEKETISESVTKSGEIYKRLVRERRIRKTGGERYRLMNRNTTTNRNFEERERERAFLRLSDEDVDIQDFIEMEMYSNFIAAQLFIFFHIGGFIISLH